MKDNKKETAQNEQSKINMFKYSWDKIEQQSVININKYSWDITN